MHPQHPMNNNGQSQMMQSKSVNVMSQQQPQPDMSVSPTFPSTCVTPTLPPHVNSNEVRVGVGVVNWLSTQAGLINSADFGTVSFQVHLGCSR